MTPMTSLQPLRDLADGWRSVGERREAADELTAALDRLAEDACDCTAGVDHVHTGGEA